MVEPAWLILSTRLCGGVEELLRLAGEFGPGWMWTLMVRCPHETCTSCTGRVVLEDGARSELGLLPWVT